jgi:hypothetical protein
LPFGDVDGECSSHGAVIGDCDGEEKF